ncbi:glycyl radical protein [Desulfoscipio geothermicus]|uniref:Formate C-acetyltransferase n=1 Tax=Desulfoscipio geothermicus DSM 3669 TaxID=1121426 RepID=A0A1I6D5X9_9FIRM|nr:glycyl radical protein [Desulfoscipio geothermicus]SFR00858.1 formate C-acetyltransferase [Desulfoscipio geothermicus DSM 3669]
MSIDVERKRFREACLKKLRQPKLTTERVVLVTEVHKESEGLPTIMRRALMLKKILSKMTIYIKDYELIVGGLGPEPFSAPIYPEFSWQWVLEQLDDFNRRDGDRFNVCKEDKKILSDLLPYWRGKAVEDVALAAMPEEVKAAREAKLIAFENMLTGGIGHYLPNYEKVLRKGLRNILAEIDEKQKKLDLTNPEEFDQYVFYKAVKISCEAVIYFAKRYADLAESQMSSCSTKRKAALEEIVRVCKRVPAEPAQTFHEALQSLWFIHLICYINQNGLAVTLGRMDQYLYPYYKTDIEKGVMDKEKVLSLLESFWIKCNEIIKLYNNTAASYYGGFPITQAPQVGGFTPEGRDATNELSELILEVEERVKLPQPDIGVLYTKEMSNDFLAKACSLIPHTMKPKIFNAHIGLDILLSLGIPLQDARNYAFVGCVESSVPGKTWGWHNAGLINFGKCVELAMNDGIDMKSGQRLGPPTGNFESFGTFDDFLYAYRTQVASAVRLLVTALHVVEDAHRKVLPLPFESVLIDDCLEKGQELNSGGACYNFTGIQGIGLATAADSLAAINSHIFEHKRLKPSELLNAVKSNFVGKENIRLLLLNDSPKYGNDNDQVDSLARLISQHYCEEVFRYQNRRGGKFIPGLFSISAHVPFGQGVVTADGRKCNDPLSDACSPAQGRIRRGPTAVARSVAKLDHVQVANGTLLNVKFPVSTLKGEEKIIKLASYVRTFMELGGFHIQVNVVNVELLREAQKYPEKYPDLMVRVAAYVALFTQLSKEMQDEIIARSELEI